MSAPNCAYYANRANAWLELGENQQCIEDCTMALKIDPKHTKSYYRKAVALFNLGNLEEVKKTVGEGLNNADDTEMLKEIGKKVRKEDKADDATMAAYPEKFPKI